jgi:hypothetical protein
MAMPLLPTGYSVIKQWNRKRGVGEFWVCYGDRVIGVAFSWSEVDRMIEFDTDGNRMHQALPESRAKPKTFKRIAID